MTRRFSIPSSGIDFKALMERKLKTMRREEIIMCPNCGYVFDMCEGMEKLITYWGENGPVEEDCPECEAQLLVTESVRRTYEVERRKAAAAAGGDDA